MKTTLPEAITNVDEAKSFLKALYDNNEVYHCEDNAHDIIWQLPADQEPTHAEKDQLNKLMADIYALPELENYPNPEWDPCGYVLSLDSDYEFEED